jgi:hypothetical protein|tara:strand:+ start:2269 stop:3621 length:1353 start_codon:yes stop_codon:yes gene_type:complete
LVTIPDLSQDAVAASLKKKLRYIEDERIKERDYLMDWYEGVNIDRYIADYFGRETLRQAPILNQNITRRVCAVRSMTYKRPPRMRASDKYLEIISTESLNSQRRLLERLTFLLGSMAIRSKWNELTQKLEYEILSHFEPIFLAGDSRDKPIGVCYPIEYQGNARLDKPLHAVWIEERPGYPGQHYLLDEHGNRLSVNDGDINPYGVMPVTFTHRYPPIRDYHSVANAMDIVQTDLAVNVAQFELQLAIRYSALGIKYISGVDDSSRISIGTDKLLYLPEGANFGVTNSGGSLQEIIDATRFLVESTLNNNHIRAKYARDDAGNAPSAASLSILEMEARDITTGEKEDTWRPWEQKRYEVDREILRVETGIDVGSDYSVDYLEPNYALTPDTEISLWTWRFEQGLATKQDYFDYMNPDASPEQRAEFETRQQEEETQQQEPQNRLLARLEG